MNLYDYGFENFLSLLYDEKNVVWNIGTIYI